MEMKRNLGRVNRPAVSTMEGQLFDQSRIDALLAEILEEMYDNYPTSFPAEIDKKEKIGQHYHCFRTF